MIIFHGFILMILGMGVVFLFLELLVLVLKASAYVVPKFSYLIPDPEPVNAGKKKATKAGDEGAAIAAAIAAAVAASRK